MLKLRLPPEIEERLAAPAKATGRSKSDHAREAIIEHIGDLEDISIAERRLKDFHAGRMESLPLDEVMRRYGLTDR